jgi:hypothetical protein
MQPQPIKKTVQVINQLESKSSFGLDPDSGEQVFIGSRLCKQQGVEEGDMVDVFVIPNDRNPSVAWYAIYVRRAGDAEPAEPATPVAQEPKGPSPIRAFLEDGPATTRQVADHLGIGTPDATRRLMTLHKNGTVARAEVRKRFDQEKASYVVWALDAHDFLPEDGDG